MDAAVPSEADRQALAALIRNERLYRRMTIEQAAEVTGMSPVTWAKIEKGQAVRSLTYAAVEQTFNWPRASIDMYLQGRVEPPTKDSGPPTVDEQEDLPEHIMKILDEQALPEEDRLQIVAILQAEAARDEDQRMQQQADRVRLVTETWRRARAA